MGLQPELPADAMLSAQAMCESPGICPPGLLA